MSNQYFFSSLTRIADLDTVPFEVKSLSRSQWATGDYVMGEVIPPLNPSAKVELPNGRMANLLPGDSISFNLPSTFSPVLQCGII